MQAGLEKRLLIVWLLLGLITALQLWLGGAGDGLANATANAGVTVSVLGMALVKVRFILREFMEVRHAPVLLGRLTDGWLALTAVILFGTYFVGMTL